ncbi:PAS domain S-box protein [Daejeonella lutea]|uniref:histidine kinase n=1 Tax=Daejeonella lutea TaxID=572036 RepID=A0A1T5ABM6_9SPHI|nr:PAS domain S-box protein [Daejeonella lutea]SKB32083.1 PAS domain S-box-containing protein [Daejeonella lutea]
MISVDDLLQVLKISPAPLALIGLSQNSNQLLFANNCYQKLLGLPDQAGIDLVYKDFITGVSTLDIHDVNRLEQAIQDVFSTGNAIQVSKVNVQYGVKDGDSNDFVLFDHSPILDDGAVKFVCQTIVLPKLASQSSFDLERARNSTQKIMESSLDVICTVDREGCFVSVSAAAKRIWGFEPEELIGRPYIDLVFTEDKDLTLKASYDIIGGTEMTNFENRYVRKDGTLVNIVWSARWDEADQIMYCIAKDATEKKAAEFELITSEKRYRTLVEHGDDAIVILGANGKAIYVSPSITRVLGYSEEEALALSLEDILHPADRVSVSRRMAEAMVRPGETINGQTARIRHKDGSWRWIEATLTNMFHDPMINGIVDNFRDVTDKKEAELENNLMISNTEESFVLLDIDLNIVSYNNQFQHLYQRYFNTTVIKGDSILTYVSPERRPGLAQLYANVLLGGSELSEVTVYEPDTKEKRIFSLKYKPARGESGEIIGAFVTATDITERHQVLEQLTSSQERYRLLFHSSPLPIFVYDFLNFGILDVNDTAIEKYGYSRDEFLKRSILDILSESEIESHRLREMHEHIEIADRALNFGIFKHRKKHGALVHSDVSVYKIKYDGRDCMMAACNDVTERDIAFQLIKENETKLLAAQKIAKVGYWQSFPDKKGLYWSDEVYNIWERDKRTFKLDFESHFNTIHPDDQEEFMLSRERAFKDGVQHDVEHRILLPDGSIKWVHALGNLIRNEKGEILIFEGTVQDITKDKLALEKLLISEARHRGILESQTNYMIRTDLEGNYTFYNQKFVQDFGWLYGSREIIGMSVLSSVMEYHHDQVLETVSLCFANLNKVFQVFVDKPRKGGVGVVTTLWDFICLTDSKGRPSEIQCIGIDVSEWKQAQQELEESNTRYEYVTKATSDAIWDWDLRTDEVYRGSGFKALFGRSVQAGPGQTFWEEFIHPGDIEHVRTFIRKAKQGQIKRWTLEYRFKKDSGDYAFVQDKCILISDKEGVPVKMVGAIQDITRRRIAEKQKTLQAETSLIFNSPREHLNDILSKVLGNLLHYGDIAIAEIWLLESDLKSMTLVSKSAKSPEMEEFYQASRNIKSLKIGEGIPGKVWQNRSFIIWDSIDQDLQFPRHEAALMSGIKTALGMPLSYNDELLGTLVLGIQEKGQNFLEHESFRDEFCKHLSSEIKRKQLDQELSQIFSFAPDVITVAGNDGYFKKINPAACKILGYSEEELLGNPIATFVHPDDQKRTDKVIRNLSRRRKTVHFENRCISKAGKVVWLAWASTPSPEDNLIFAVAKDVTEKKNLEFLLEKSNRLAEIGSWELDIQQGSLYWGPIARKIHDLEEDFVPGIESWLSFYDEGLIRDTVRTAIHRAIETGVPWDMELEILTAIGKRKWIRSIGEVERVNGNVVKLYGNFQNINNRKIAELERTNYIEAIEKQNQRFSEIAWIQSHVVRAPIARLMGLVDLIKHPASDEELKKELLGYVFDSATELDGIVREITLKTEEIDLNTERELVSIKE